MKTQLVLVLPHLFGSHPDESIVNSGKQVLDEVATRSTATAVEFPREDLQLLLSTLGIQPDVHPISEGAVRSFGIPFESGPKSVFLAFDLISIQEDGLVAQPAPPSPEEEKWLTLNLPRLISKRLEVAYLGRLQGALHWREGSTDHLTHPVRVIEGKSWRQALPEGDGEPMLRQWIDDSTNLLLEAEFNRIRIDQGIPPISMAWPWGGGREARLPNLPVNLQHPVTVMSEVSQALTLARMAGCQTLDLGNIWSNPMRSQIQEGINIFITGAFIEARRHGRTERMEELWNRMAEAMISEFLKLTKVRPRSLVIVGSSPLGSGLAVSWSSELASGDRVPYHERVLGDPKLPRQQLWEFIHGLSRSS